MGASYWKMLFTPGIRLSVRVTWKLANFLTSDIKYGNIFECRIYKIFYDGSLIYHDLVHFPALINPSIPSRSVLLWPGGGYPLPGGMPANPSYHEHRAWDHGGLDRGVWLPASSSGTHVAVLSGQRPPSFPTWSGDPPSCQDGLCQAALLLQS